jgi:hypothetical protein
MSKPDRPGVIRASVAVALHFGHGGLCTVFMMLRLDQAGALQNSQSPIDAVLGAVIAAAWNGRYLGAVPFCSLLKN